MILTMDAWGHNNMNASETAAKKAYHVVFKDMAEMNADLERVLSTNQATPIACAVLRDHFTQELVKRYLQSQL